MQEVFRVQSSPASAVVLMSLQKGDRTEDSAGCGPVYSSLPSSGLRAPCNGVEQNGAHSLAASPSGLQVPPSQCNEPSAEFIMALRHDCHLLGALLREATLTCCWRHSYLDEAPAVTSSEAFCINTLGQLGCGGIYL